MSQTDYSRYPIQRHGGEFKFYYRFDFYIDYCVGVLGFCSIVLSNPYDIPTYLPNILMFLCEHSHDPDLIQVCYFSRFHVNYNHVYNILFL